ncbi:MAG: N-acetylneuraminate epimerase precursor [Planctomycetota bacterium]
MRRGLRSELLVEGDLAMKRIRPATFGRQFSEVCARSLSGFLAWACLGAAAAQAHFLWVVPQSTSQGARVAVYFGEQAAPDDPALLDKVATASLWAAVERGQPRELKLSKSDNALVAPLDRDQAFAPVILRHTYGVATKGGDSFLLNYYAKGYSTPLPGLWRAVKDSERLPLEIVPQADQRSVRFQVLWKGEPLAQALVTVEGPGLEMKREGTTDASGVFRCELAAAGLYSIRAKHVEEAAGKHGDQAYTSVRHYSTLALPYQPIHMTPIANSFPPLAKGTTSFGGAVLGDTLYVYGGNYGSAHSYSEEDMSGELWTLDLKGPGKWQPGPSGQRLQGLAMVEHRGRLIRVGGFRATNKEGEKENLRSQPEVARLSVDGKSWELLTPLPAGRSSLDAAVIGDTLYVVGGWNLQGGSRDALWHDTLLAADLTVEPLAWKPVASPPFKRRALSAAAWQGKLYCIGGMEEQGAPTTAVAVYDPAVNAWTEGPAVLGGPMEGFGTAAFATEKGLFVTTMSGSIQKMAADGKAWQVVGQLTHPRFFHRLLPWSGSKLVVVGGSNMTTGKIEDLELLAP